MKNYAEFGGCNPPKPKNLLDLHSSSYQAQPHEILVNYQVTYGTMKQEREGEGGGGGGGGGSGRGAVNKGE